MSHAELLHVCMSMYFQIRNDPLVGVTVKCDKDARLHVYRATLSHTCTHSCSTGDKPVELLFAVLMNTKSLFHISLCLTVIRIKGSLGIK